MINEQEYFFKDFFIIFSAIFGFVVLIYVQLKNSGFRFRPYGRRRGDYNKANADLSHKKLGSVYAEQCFYLKNSIEIRMEDYYTVWNIGLFSTQKMFDKKSQIQNLQGKNWYKFSDSKKNTEKIMSPLFRKIFNKYKNSFDSEKSIQFETKNHEDNCLYTWLKNESHIHTAIYSFLDECVYITGEIKMKPSLLVTLSDVITVEIIFPHNELLISFEDAFRELYAVDFIIEPDVIRITLWIAFTEHKIPDICTGNYRKSNNNAAFLTDRKVS
ncbi:MAG: hypothetical protein V4591_06770 [Bdellovibrionota bacterium]